MPNVYTHEIKMALSFSDINYGLVIAIVSLTATCLFFYHQNCKTKQHLCLNEIINRLELIINLVKSSYNPTGLHYEIYSGFAFHSELVKYGVEKFIQSQPYHFLELIFVKNKKANQKIIDDLTELIEYIDLYTPVESPSNHNVHDADEQQKIIAVLNDINASSNSIIKSAYNML